jgi:purine nucleoside permease
MSTLSRCAVLVVSLFAVVAGAQVPTAAHPWHIHAVIIATFQTGVDSGDMPGELQHWVHGEHLDEALVFPAGFHPLRTNRDHTVLAMLSGTTIPNATASMMALGLDPRFDLTRAYIFITGIAGVDPQVASMGSAAWAHFVIGDVVREIDPRDAPASWPYGLFPVTATGPNPPPLGPPAANSSWFDTNLYPLNAKLADWAFAQTKDTKLPDEPAVAAFRAKYTETPAARRPPFVLIGDSFASDYFWHGRRLTNFARDWVKYWTRGQGTFTMTEMEDSGFMVAIGRLQGHVDAQRVLVLRTASNYCEPPPGLSATDSLQAPRVGGLMAFEDTYLVGSVALHKLLATWPQMPVQ